MFSNQSFNNKTQNPFEPHFRNCGGFWSRKSGRHGFGGGHPWAHKLQQFMNDRKAANIEETDQTYILSLYAAGLKKEHFNISVNDEVLTIQYTAANNTEARYIHQEYQPASFERSFQLSDKVLTDSIAAVYTDGVLQVTLQKNPETTKPAQEVKVA